jgi:hypothetical protein
MLEAGEHCESTGGVFPVCCNSTSCLMRSSSHVCRAASDQCDEPEMCSGVSVLCPPDAKKANLDSCDDGKFCTGNDVCLNGVCTGLDSTCACSVSTVVSDCPNTNPCTDVACVGDMCSFTNRAAGTTCSDNNACTKNDACNGQGVCVGVSVSCAHLTSTCSLGQCFGGACFAISVRGGVCRASTNVSCDRDEVCTGFSTLCPADTGVSCIVNSKLTCELGVTYELRPANFTHDRHCVNVTICGSSYIETQVRKRHCFLCVRVCVCEREREREKERLFTLKVNGRSASYDILFIYLDLK